MRSQPRLILMRHGICEKNIAGRHGGRGMALTAEGRNEVDALADTLRRRGLTYDLVVYTPRIQCEQSAAILGAANVVPMLKADYLAPIDLGIIDGLSEDEVAERFPRLASQLEMWRSGAIEVSELAIPGMESPTTFYRRGLEAVDAITGLEGLTLVNATRSILVLLASVLLRRTPHRGGGYQEIPWPNGGYLVFHNANHSWQLDLKQSSFEIRQ